MYMVPMCFVRTFAMYIVDMYIVDFSTFDVVEAELL